MGLGSSSIAGAAYNVHALTGKAIIERNLRDSKLQLKRAMSKSNSMEALDHSLIAEINSDIKKSESVLSMFEYILKSS